MKPEKGKKLLNVWLIGSLAVFGAGLACFFAGAMNTASQDGTALTSGLNQAGIWLMIAGLILLFAQFIVNLSYGSAKKDHSEN